MIQWVHHACLEWGRAKRRIMDGTEGWPTRSMLGRLIEEGACGASQPGMIRNRYPEVMLGNALQVSIALTRMAASHRMEIQCLVVSAHYVAPGCAPVKAQLIDIAIKDYWKKLHEGHIFIAAHFVEAPDELRAG